MFRKSIRAQTLALIAGSLLLLTAIALLSQSILSSSVGSYGRLVAGPVQASLLIERANSQFKTQVQEWKNVLLRGKDPAALDKYWTAFQQQEREVQSTLNTLGALEGLPQVARGSVEALSEEHLRLGKAYRSGHQAFVASGQDPQAGDLAVKGIDRAASEQMNSLVSGLRQQAENDSAEIAARAARAVLIGTLMLIFTGIALTFLSIWRIDRSMVGPVRKLIDQVTALSEGRLGAKSSIKRDDELGRLADAANTLDDFLVLLLPSWRSVRVSWTRRVANSTV